MGRSQIRNSDVLNEPVPMLAWAGKSVDPLRRKAWRILLPERLTLIPSGEALESKRAVGQMRQQHGTKPLVGGNKVIRHQARIREKNVTRHPHTDGLRSLLEHSGTFCTCAKLTRAPIAPTRL
jgi:hypothetical protein